MAPHETQLQLFGRLVGMRDHNAEIKRLRRAVEPALLDLLCAERSLGRGQARPGELPVTSSNIPWLAANPDGWSGDTLLVVKSCLWLPPADLASDPPFLAATVQHELLATGAERAAIGVELQGGWFKTGWVVADAEFQAVLLDAESAFVERLEQRQPPPPESSADLEVVKRLWPEDDGSTVRMGADTLELWRTIKVLRAKARDSKARAKKLEAKLRASAVGHSFVKLPGGVRLSLESSADSAGRVGRRLVERR